MHAKKVLAMNRPPASLREVMEDTSGRSLAALKKELVEGRVALEKAAKKCGIRGQVWWAEAGEKKGRSREVNAVQDEGESPAIAAIMKSMEAMQVTVAALAAAQAGGGVIAGVETEKQKEESELEKLKAENERLKAAQGDGNNGANNWEQRYRPRGKASKRGKGKGPAQGCFTCGGPHYQNQCPQWQGKGHWGGKGGGYGGGYGKGYGQGGGGYNGKGGYGGYGSGQSWGQQGQQQQQQQQPASNQNNQNQATVPVNSVEQQNGEQRGNDNLELTPPSQVVATATTGPSGALTTTGDHGELSRATILLYPQYVWAQVMGRQMVQPQQEVPPMGPGIQEAGLESKEQAGHTGQGEGDPAPSPTPWCPALHHAGTGAAQCLQGEGREAVVPPKCLPGTSEGPAGQTQQAGGARDPASQHHSQYEARSHQGLHWDRNREVWEQPRQRLDSRGSQQESWRGGKGSSACDQQASSARCTGSEDRDTATHSVTSGEAATQAQWTRQLELWAINKMVAATEEELSRAAAGRHQPEAGRNQPGVQEEPVGAPGKCPLAEAGGVCMVGQCEWCRQEQEQGSAQGSAQQSEGVGEVAGVGKRPASERHMVSRCHLCQL